MGKNNDNKGQQKPTVAALKSKDDPQASKVGNKVEPVAVVVNDDGGDSFELVPPFVHIAEEVFGRVMSLIDDKYDTTSSGDEYALIDIATFLRKAPDAPIASVYTLLNKKYGLTVEPDAMEYFLTAVEVFKVILFAGDRVAKRDQARRKAEEDGKKEPATWGGEQALKPEDAPFSPTGFKPIR